jgi:4'-phosphopantetheinyl transferase EntD
VLERIVPPAVAVAERHDDALTTALHPEERELVARAVAKRRREFATGRALAREALAELDVAPAPLLAGQRGEPRWPAGIVGSITHCDGYRGCAVARGEVLLTLGIDAEPDAPLPAGLLADIALPGERAALARLAAEHPGPSWDRLLFSAKEAVYKAWFPLARRWLGFEDAELSIDPGDGTFAARLLVPGPSLAARPLRGFVGRWLAEDGLLLTAIALPASPRPP